MSVRSRESDGPVAEAVRAMYAAYPDPAGFDVHLHPQITIWESDQPGPLIGLDELNALRDRRSPDDGATRPRLSVEDLLVDRWDTTVAVARYVLRATAPDGELTFRVSDVWVGAGGRWEIVHHHADHVAGASGTPVPMADTDQ
jgi:hypothetical protein